MREILKRALNYLHIHLGNSKNKKDSLFATVDSHEPIFLKYGEKARQQGFNQLYLLLSFDCDTPEDILPAEALFSRLSDLGIQSVFAVPGAQLKEGAKTYRRMADNGANFINHGSLPHAEWRDDRYYPVTFYNDMTSQEVVEDIKQGDSILKDTIGFSAKGFRAPHFGTFQLHEQLQLLYQTLKDLGYYFSTSTLPALAFSTGPVISVDEGMYEIPLSGSFSFPETILDSWNYVQDYFDPKVKMVYADLLIETVDKLLSLDVVGVLNYYVDPFHVYQTEAFDRVLKYIVKKKIKTVVFDDLIGIIEGLEI